MLNPKYERKETLECAGCVVSWLITGYAPDLNYITFACISNAGALTY